MNEEEIFHQALGRSLPGERAAYLEQACAGNAALRASVEALLRAHVGASGFMDRPERSLLATVDEPPVTERPGTVIGPYKLLEQIGEGGFGVVFMAEQQHPVRRKVALKLLKPGMDTRQVVARFEAERQALALMDHPHIAHIFDGGETASGRPFFVMELVRGVPITDFCDQNQLPIRERLELYVTVCQAVQHAHQKGIIHRDLKPSNILVTVHDDKPVVKVIDFGIAKATGQQLTEKTLFTNFAQMIGTPLYMSPEQAQRSGLDIDTRSDIYALGVLLYELLTGTTPFDQERLRTAAYEEILRIIREEEPARPSTRISILGQAATGVSANRQSDPKRLVQLCRGELDWIVMKALEKDRNRRYESASAFAADVQRYLHDEPVQACPPSAWYRFRKFARRHKRTLAISSLLCVMLLAAVMAVVASALWAAAQAEAGARVEAEAKEKLEGTLYFHRIALAHRELTANLANPARAEALLEACPPDRRGWEWDYLKRLWRVEPVALHGPGKTEVNSVAFSPDGEHLAAACGDGTVQVWHVKTGQVVTLHGHAGNVVSVVFSPTDGCRLASTGVDKTVRVWDLSTRQEVCRHRGYEAPQWGAAYSVTFSPDGRWLAAGSEGETVRVWDAATGQLIHELPGHEMRASCVAFSRDGQLLASGSWNGTVRIWRAGTGQCLFRLPGEHTHPVGAVAFSPDGKYLATGYFDRLIVVWDTTTGKRLHTLAGHTGLVLGLAFSPDGRLASASEDRTVRIWDLPTEQEVLHLRGHSDWCQGLAFSPDGRLLASASRDGTVRFWDATPLTGKESQEVLTFRKHTHEVWSVAISPDGSRIASAGLDPTVPVWDATTGQVIQTFSEITQVVFSVVFSPDGRRLAAAGIDSIGPKVFVLKVWDVQTGQLVYTHREPREILATQFSPPDGRWLALGLLDGTVKLVDTWTDREISFIDKHDRDVVWGGVTFRPDGRRLASASREGNIKLWDATAAQESLEGWRAWLPLLGLWPQFGLSGALPMAAVVHVPLASWLETSKLHSVRTLPSSGATCWSVAFSPDGHRLLKGSLDGGLTLWDAETGKEIGTIGGHGEAPVVVAYGPDGRWLASAGGDCIVRVWDATALKVIQTFRGHRGPIRCLAVSQNGKFLVTGSTDKTVKVWDLTHLNKRLKSHE